MAKRGRKPARKIVIRRRHVGTAPAAPESTQLVQALTRGLSLLNGLAENVGGVSLSDLAQQVGLPASTTHRLLTTLEEQRYVRFDPELRSWSVGVQAFIAGSGFARSRSLLDIARPRMRGLMEQSGETVNLAIADGGEAVFLAQVECWQMMRALASPGARVPMHSSGVGKALLSTMSEIRLSRILHKHGLPRMTPMTVTTLARLRIELARTRERGYAVDDQEHAIGLRCVAAPIFDEHGDAIGAISLSGPMIRLCDERIPVLGQLVRDTAETITIAYGGNRQSPE
jgi:IclR family acetate operon transcriptional repressor